MITGACRLATLSLLVSARRGGGAAALVLLLPVWRLSANIAANVHGPVLLLLLPA